MRTCLNFCKRIFALDIFSYHFRPISDDDLKKISDRIQAKLARRQQKETPKPVPTTTTTVPNFQPPPSPVVNTFIPPTLNNEPFSIFREPPVPRPTTKKKKRKVRFDFHLVKSTKVTNSS